ncbi:FlgK family flagellar hook-associated protein [Sphingorhabdus sp. M41]|uniref:FlgK family flagellar hook-associated protein n=1 Tax=Sphingorhabdus sp. M41 TaxID=1806885 RepID=UPI00078E51BD|nr:flagellar basal body rod C-terminal domain-containing protein [Sphingorhabdus sp. M41]AMO72590.1 hypothetical protein AZE99_12680 [Sphingorhabdus sp. M41]
MSLSEILSTAVSGLGAAQGGLRTVSSNIANINTPGYARERTVTTSNAVQGRGAGVIVGEPARVADRFLESAVYTRSSATSAAATTANYLARLDAALGEPGAATSLPARLDAVEAAAIRLTGTQAGNLAVGEFTDTVEDALFSMRQFATDIDQLRGEAAVDIASSINRTNSLLSQVHELNGEIGQLTASGRTASGLENRRNAVVEELGSLIAINVRHQTGGRLEIETAGGTTLLDQRLRVLDYPPDNSDQAQKDYPPVSLRFAGENGTPGPATGTVLDGPAIGGRIGALMSLRDARLPQVADDIARLQRGLAAALNQVANEATASPPPTVLEGRATGLAGNDIARFSGRAIFAVTDRSGVITARTEVDFDSLGAAATVDDVVAVINAGLGGRANASFTDGQLTIRSTSATEGVVVAPGDPPAIRGGNGFAHFFGLNDITQGTASSVGSGFTAADPHGFGAGETAEIVLRDSAGRLLGRTTMRADDGSSWGDIVSNLNSGSLGGFGAFRLATDGQMVFDANPATGSTVLSITSDSTNRRATGNSFTQLSGLIPRDPGVADTDVRAAFRDDPSRVGIAFFDTSAVVGQRSVGAGDRRAANAYSAAFTERYNLAENGAPATLSAHSANILGAVGSAAGRASDNLALAEARQSDAVNRRDSFSAVNIDEELAQMVILQNSYSAAARVVSTASEMYDTLLQMVR